MSEAGVIRRRSFRRRLVARAGVDEAILHALRERPDALIEQGTILKSGDRCTVARIAGPSNEGGGGGGGGSGGGGGAVIKRYNRRGLFHTLTHLLARSRASWCWANAQRVRAAGLRTPTPLAFVEERWGPFRGRSFLIVEHVPGVPLVEWVVAHANDARVIEAMADRFADIWRALGKARLGHGDMKATNFLVDGAGELWLIDLDGMRPHPPGPTLARARKRDRARFLRNWQDRPEVQAIFQSRLDTSARRVG